MNRWPDPQPITWTGQSGKQYTYYVRDLNFVFDPGQVGNYIFTRAVPKPTGGNTHHPVYIGETADGFRERFSGHEKMPCIRENGATHVVAHINEDKAAREDEETDLRNKWTTPCNDQ